MSAGYLRPRRLDDALESLAAGSLAVLAGGTDFYPARVGLPLDEPVLDITAIDELRGVTALDGAYRIGALTTWSDVLHGDLPPCFDGLVRAAREVGGIQIQNVATLCGNVCNASPAADGVPNLLALDAAVELQSVEGARTASLSEFVVGNRRTARAPHELVTALIVPAPPARARATFLKLGARRYLVISIAMVAALVATDTSGCVSTARVAVGACSSVARRLPALEEALLGQDLAPGIGTLVTPAHLAPLTPIDDVRGTAAYRLDAARTLTARALDALATPDHERPA